MSPVRAGPYARTRHSTCARQTGVQFFESLIFFSAKTGTGTSRHTLRIPSGHSRSGLSSRGPKRRSTAANGGTECPHGCSHLVGPISRLLLSNLTAAPRSSRGRRFMSTTDQWRSPRSAISPRYRSTSVRFRYSNRRRRRPTIFRRPRRLW